MSKAFLHESVFQSTNECRRGQGRRLPPAPEDRTLRRADPDRARTGVHAGDKSIPSSSAVGCARCGTTARQPAPRLLLRLVAPLLVFLLVNGLLTYRNTVDAANVA